MEKTNADIHVNKKYKDTVFRKLFGENKENALILLGGGLSFPSSSSNVTSNFSGTNCPARTCLVNAQTVWSKIASIRFL